MKQTQALEAPKETAPAALEAENARFAYPGEKPVFSGLSFRAEPGQIIGVTGPVACGKSTLGKTFLCEYPYRRERAPGRTASFRS